MAIGTQFGAIWPILSWPWDCAAFFFIPSIPHTDYMHTTMDCEAELLPSRQINIESRIYRVLHTLITFKISIEYD